MGATTRLQLRVSPGGRRAEIIGRHGEAWKVRVAAPPEDGKANEAVVRLLAATLDLPKGDVILVSGHGGRDKVVSLTGMSLDDAERRLGSAAGSAGASAA